MNAAAIMNLKLEICNAFNHHAPHYEKVAKVQHEIGVRLLKRLDYLKVNPRYILDLGCGSGTFSQLLKKYYPKSHIIGLDIATSMLAQSKKKQGWRCKWSLVNADMTRLPFADGLFDLVFSNQTIHWSQSLPEVFKEISRVMNTNGCLMFSTLGPDTFKELKQAWMKADSYSHTNHFIDMHEIGDQLIAEYFLDPVIDMEMIKAQYATLKELVQSLKQQGVRNINELRNKGLTGREAWRQFDLAYQALVTTEKKYPLTYEVVYGQAWKGQKIMHKDVAETYISISDIKHR